MELKEYINETIVGKLKEKGFDESSIKSKIEEFIKEKEQVGFEGNTLKLSVKNRIKGYFAPILRSNNVTMKAVIFTLSDVYDENERINRMSELKLGSSGYKPNLDYVVEAGFYPWGNMQGKMIPKDPFYNQDGFIGIEYKGKFHYKTLKLSGNWLNDKESNIAKSGDIVSISLDPEKLEQAVIYLQKYKYVEQLEESKYVKLINENLKAYHKTIGDLVERNYNGFAIVKGSVSEIESGQFGYSFDVIDDADNWDVETNLTASMKEVPFIAGSDDLIFIGDVYKKSNASGYQMRVYNVIVPDKFKRKELPKENQDIVEEGFNEDLSGIDLDEDLL